MTRGVDLGVGARVLERLRTLPELGEAEFLIQPKPLSGGRFSSVWHFQLVHVPDAWAGPLVLRSLADRNQAALEAALQQGARAGGLSCPRLLLTDHDEQGLSLMVMERLPGRGYLRGVEPWRFAIDFPKLVTRWPERFAHVLSVLARVDVAAVRGELDRYGIDSATASTNRHLSRVTAVLETDRSYHGQLEWLHTHAPTPPARATLVHGDLWPANVFLRGADIALIDWSNGAIGDPALDVGFAKIGWRLMPQPFPPPPPIAQIAAAAGRSISDRISTKCDHLVGGSDRVRYYEALRCAVEIANITEDNATGRTSGWAKALPVLLRHIDRIIKSRARRH